MHTKDSLYIIESGKLSFDLVRRFHCLSWVPTIKGDLSFNLLNDESVLIGDIDKRLLHKKLYNESHKSEHYIVATSLCTFEDDEEENNKRKCSENCRNNTSGKADFKKCPFRQSCIYHAKYNRCFRFLFVGSVKDNAEFRNGDETIRIKGNNDFMTGSVYIIPQTGKYTDRYFSDVMASIETVCKQFDTDDKKDPKKPAGKILANVNEYDENHKQIRSAFLSHWKSLNEKIETLEKGYDGEPYAKPWFKFDVLMMRDGILLVRESISPRYRGFVKGIEETDRTESIPMPRIFKTAASYVKFLFHCNYNHYDKNDTYMPVSNLHFIKTEEDMERAVRHQFESMLSPVMDMRRANYSSGVCDPEGIVEYASSFLAICSRRGWIKDNEREYYRTFLTNLKNDVARSHGRRRSAIIDFFTVNKNRLAIFLVALTFALAAKELISLFAIPTTPVYVVQQPSQGFSSENEDNLFIENHPLAYAQLPLKLTNEAVINAHQPMLGEMFGGDTTKQDWIILILAAIFGVTIQQVVIKRMEKNIFMPRKKEKLLLVSATGTYIAGQPNILPFTYRCAMYRMYLKSSHLISIRRRRREIFYIAVGIALAFALYLIISHSFISI